jgi:hypothetical protein
MEKMVKLRFHGAKLARGAISEDLDRQRLGTFELIETDGQGMHPLMAVARFRYLPEPGYTNAPELLLEARIRRWKDNKIRVVGIEQGRNAAGDVIEYKQEWLCITNVPSPPPPKWRKHEF